MESGNETEKKTISAMIRIYCRSVHRSRHLYGYCRNLEEYALNRIDYCAYGVDKPVCQQCTVHCYSPLMREEIKKVMHYSGPRMLLRHPLLSIAHMIREKRKLKEKTLASLGEDIRSEQTGINNT